MPNKKLFMVPWLQATCLNGFNMRSTSFWDVYTFPPTTAASLEGERMVLSGIMIVIGTKHPEFKGISSPISDLKQYKIALLVIDLGALVFPKTSFPVPLKSKTAFLFNRSIVKVKCRGVPSSIN